MYTTIQSLTRIVILWRKDTEYRCYIKGERSIILVFDTAYQKTKDGHDPPPPQRKKKLHDQITCYSRHLVEVNSRDLRKNWLSFFTSELEVFVKF